MVASGAKRPFTRKRDLVVDNERVENYPVSNRQGDRKTFSLLRRGQGARQGAFAEYWIWNENTHSA
jgi:hypothetical protein